MYILVLITKKRLGGLSYKSPIHLLLLLVVRLRFHPIHLAPIPDLLLQGADAIDRMTAHPPGSHRKNSTRNTSDHSLDSSVHIVLQPHYITESAIFALLGSLVELSHRCC